jgi:hypothetical protein
MFHCRQISVSIIVIFIRRELPRYRQLMFMPWWSTLLYIIFVSLTMYIQTGVELQ